MKCLFFEWESDLIPMDDLHKLAALYPNPTTSTKIYVHAALGVPYAISVLVVRKGATGRRYWVDYRLEVRE